MGEAQREVFELATKLLDACDFSNAVTVLAALSSATYHVAHAMQHASFPAGPDGHDCGDEHRVEDHNMCVIDSCMQMGLVVAQMLDACRHTQCSEVVKA